MSPTLKLTVLDQTPVHPSPANAIHGNAGQMSIELAKTCDLLGYERFWVAEHHNSGQFAGPSPEILITRIASVTQNMRIGSGGVMLNHYSPLKVAEVFNMLAALFPDRIDLGIGRAPGGDALATTALAWPNPPQDGSNYPTQAATLKALLKKNLPDDHPWADLHISPIHSDRPQMWMLGSSGGSAALAGQLGMHLALARFISPDHCHPSIFDAYSQAWDAAGHTDAPKRMLAIGAFCADTQEQAELLAGTAVYRKLTTAGYNNPLLPPEEVQDIRLKLPTSKQAEYDHLLSGYTVGTPERCKAEIEDLAKIFNTGEIAIVTVTYDFEARLDSYRLIID